MPIMISFIPTPVKAFRQSLPKHMRNYDLTIKSGSPKIIKGELLAKAVDEYRKRVPVKKIK